MIKKKVKRKRNPKLRPKVELILNNITENLQFLSEGNDGELYKFEINKNTLFDRTILKPGKYIIKIFKYPVKNITKLKLLSDSGLIPKIYVITSNFIIMRYIEAVNLYEFIKENKDKKLYDPEYIMKRLRFLINQWHKLGFAHGDLILTNILITDEYKIYLIDPKIESKSYQKDDDIADLEYIQAYLKNQDEND